MELLLKNNVTKAQYSFTGITDLCTSAMFYQFNINLPEGMSEGEYEYTLLDGENVMAKGLAQVGDYTPSKQTYNNTNNGYTVYGG